MIITEILFFKAHIIYINSIFSYFQFFTCELGCKDFRTNDPDKVAIHYLKFHPDRFPFMIAEKENLNVNGDTPLQTWYNSKTQFPEPIANLLSRPLIEQSGILVRHMVMPHGDVTYNYNNKVIKLQQLLLLESPTVPYTEDNFSWSKKKIGCENELCLRKSPRTLQPKTATELNAWYAKLTPCGGIERSRLVAALEFYPNIYVILTPKGRDCKEVGFAYQAKINGEMFSLSSKELNEVKARFGAIRTRSFTKIDHEKELVKPNLRCRTRAKASQKLLQLDSNNNFVFA